LYLARFCKPALSPGGFSRRQGFQLRKSIMIAFAQKPQTVVTTEAAEESRFDRIRRIAADKHKHSDAETAAPQKGEPKRPM
jgi:hypothetical protein